MTLYRMKRDGIMRARGVRMEEVSRKPVAGDRYGCYRRTMMTMFSQPGQRRWTF